MKEWLDIGKGWLTFILLVFAMVASFVLLQEHQDHVSCERYNKIADNSNKRLAFIQQVYPLLEFKSEEAEEKAASLLVDQGIPTLEVCDE